MDPQERTDKNRLVGSAVISDNGLYRYRLDREVADGGLVFLYSGVNGSTATAEEEDQTTLKWRGFTVRNGGRRYIAVNPFAYRATDVRELSRVLDPVGPDNDSYIQAAIAEADVLVPCWGNQSKVHSRWRYRFQNMLNMMRSSGKPVKVFGFTRSGDPMHPLMLGYGTVLQEWVR